MTKGSGWLIAGALLIVASSLDHIGNAIGKSAEDPLGGLPIGVVLESVFGIVLMVKGWRLDREK